MKTPSRKSKSAAGETETPKSSSAKADRGSYAAYGGKISICINTDCKLRKQAGGCFGFEGCPGFKAR